MTVVHPNAVSGINSITVQSGNSLSIHKADGSLIRTITGSTGVTTFATVSVGSAYTDFAQGGGLNIGLGASISNGSGNVLTFGTNGDDRVTINATGKLGIGDADPDEALHVYAVGGAIKVDSNGDSAVRWATAGTNKYSLYHNNSSNALIFYDNGNNAERVRITSAGLVGVNNTTPEGAGIDVLNTRTTAYSGTSDQRSSAHIVARNSSDSSGRFASISLVNGGGTQAEGSLNLVQTGNYTGDLTFKLRTGSGSSDWRERFRITSAGSVGIGTDNPGGALTLKIDDNSTNPLATGGIALNLKNKNSTDDSWVSMDFNNSVGGIVGRFGAQFADTSDKSTDLYFATRVNSGALAERLRITSTGRVLIGGQSDNSSAGGFENMLQVEGTSATSSSISIIRNSNDENPPYINFGKSRGTSVNSNTAVADNDLLGQLDWTGADGSGAFNNFAVIKAYVDGAPGNSDAPGRLVFFTTPDGSTSPTERLRITSSGSWGLAGSNFGSSGQFLKSQGSGSPVVWGDASGGIDEADIWRLTTSFQGNASGGFIGSNWERGDSDGQNHKGTGMSESSGVFTFPSTGFWFVQFTFNMTTQYTPSQPHSHRNTGYIQTCIDGSSYAVAASSASGIYNFGSNSYPSHGTGTASIIFDVTSTSNCKCRFNWGAGQGSETCTGDTSSNQTYVTFIRLADT